jgi:hypothetical protein
MKPLLDVEKNRIAYHKEPNKNTVHRSSLVVPRFQQARSHISFLNFFSIKGKIKSVVLKITAINSHGTVFDSISMTVDEPRVYTFDLEYLFGDEQSISQYLVEFYSDKNLFIPFPAVMVNHAGNDFINCVHSYNRVLNDIFEDDAINNHQVCEASIDVKMGENHDTFFNFVTGPFKVNGNIEISLLNKNNSFTQDVPVEIERLSNKNFYLSDIVNDKSSDLGEHLQENKILKVLQPKQSLFYGRLFAGVINKETLSFSANHSYYDSSSTEEYFDNNISSRAYPYFSNCKNQVTMYPIMSPSTLNVHIEIYDGSSFYKSEEQTIISPSDRSISFNIDETVADSGFTNITLFKVIAMSVNGNIPTRVNHQSIYGAKKSNSELHTSINNTLFNKQLFRPATKTGLSWGQILIDSNYDSNLGICFKNKDSGDKEDISIDFYGQSGLLKSIKRQLMPNASLIFGNDFFSSLGVEREFVWFVTKSDRADIGAQYFHTHRESHNSSGDHSF